MIRFTVDHVVVWDTITMDHLLSVYQGNANAVSDEGTIQKNAEIRTRVVNLGPLLRPRTVSGDILPIFTNYPFWMTASIHRAGGKKDICRWKIFNYFPSLT